MVRLEDDLPDGTAGVVGGFQFLCGTIGSVWILFTAFCLTYFNSSVLRLEVQHHHGVGVLFDISIPLWYDWKRNRPERRPRHFAISIPLWYDWKLDNPNHLLRFTFISIPLWYDWKDTPQVAFQAQLLFQFLCGTIGSGLGINPSISNYDFNSSAV